MTPATPRTAGDKDFKSGLLNKEVVCLKFFMSATDLLDLLGQYQTSKQLSSGSTPLILTASLKLSSTGETEA